MKDGQIRLRGLNLRLRRAGHGKPVLFLHGAGGLAGWPPFLNILADSFEVLAPDHPGFGGSDDPDWVRDIHDLAMFYLDLLDELDLHDVHVVGHSLGGWVAAEAAIRSCARIRTLSLLAPAGLRRKGLVIGDNFLWSPEEAIHNLYFSPALADELVAKRGTLDDEQVAVQAKNQRTVAKFGWEPRWFDPHLATWLHRVKVPTQIIWGADDRLFPAVLAEEWQQGLPNCRMTVIAECGHLPHIEKADLVGDSVLNFLRAV